MAYTANQMKISLMMTKDYKCRHGYRRTNDVAQHILLTYRGKRVAEDNMKNKTEDNMGKTCRMQNLCWKLSWTIPDAGVPEFDAA